ncbi:halocyanin domain-containing protein [Halobacteriales archaeon QS_4_62_28]|nr:MAG: halocyanin domain-containing protein [Halobacteriales archaeon QS_4_62_28]
MTDSLDRRTVLRSTGAVVTAGLLAGCGGDGGEDGSGDDDGGGGEDGGTTDTETDTPTETEMSTETEGGETAGASQEVSEYLSETSNFDGSVSTMTDQDTVTVTVGAEANGGAFGFDPAAINVSTGTTVQFEWTGEGGNHNVVSDGDGPLDSGEAVGEEGVNYEYTFEEAGTYLYYCTPHETLGMKGAIVVE